MIGVFDSGFGGLNILKYFINDLSGYNYIYLGDSARAPYGEKTHEDIYDYTKQAVDFLFTKGCSIIILACNSASAQALRKIQQEYLPIKYPERRVLGVVIPMVEKITENDNIKRVGVIGTKATINSEVYYKELIKVNSDLKVFQLPAPLLVPLVEEGRAGSEEALEVLNNYLKCFKKEDIEALILGCTHYPCLIKQFREIMGDEVYIPHPGEVIAESLKKYLTNHPELDIRKNLKSENKFYTTGEIDKFRKIGEDFLGQEIKNLEKIIL